MLEVKQYVAKQLRDEEAQKKLEHEKSGKLSAGKLNHPLLEQMLYILGVPEKPFDDYALHLFARGRDVEEWLINKLPGGTKYEQKLATYRGAIGYIDYIDPDGEVYEVKSVKRSQVRWLEKDGARASHKLQAGFYAMAEERDKYNILYVVADDYQVLQMTYDTAEIKPTVDSRINEVIQVYKNGLLPEFEPREKWQGGDKYPEYSLYPDWISLNQDQLMEKLSNYDKAFKKLKGEK